MVFTTPDGKSFETKKEWRLYMVEFLMFKNKVNEPEPCIRRPGEIAGNNFNMEDCENSSLVLLDHSEQVQIDNMKGCKIFVAACTSSIFARNCTDCVFYTSCRQLRLRDCVNCTLYVYSQSEVHIEDSTGLKFGPFNGGYPEHAEHMKVAKLNIAHNLWYDVYDHNDPAKTRKNWCLLPESEYADPWYPAGVCEPAIARTKAGSVARSEVEQQVGESFSLQAMKEEADRQKAAVSAASVPPAAPTAASSSSSAPPPPTSSVTPPVAPVESPVKAVAATAAATSPVAPSSSPSPVASKIQIVALIKSFCALAAGGDASALVTDDFCLILPSGKRLSAQDVGVVAPVVAGSCYAVGDVILSGDFGFCTFHSKQGDDVSACSGVFKRTAAGWRVVSAQRSLPVEAEDMPSPL